MIFFYPHTHWLLLGKVFKGEMELTIGGKTMNYQKGDYYFVPSHVEHSAVFKRKRWLMDIFADKESYQTK